MKSIKEILPRAVLLLVMFTVICGGIYTAFITLSAQILFPNKANGSIITVDGKVYGSELLAQQYQGDDYMWGRIMKLDISTYKDQSGKALMYASPSNLSPASAELEALVADRVTRLQKANPASNNAPVPVELVTTSASGLDPHISPAAAKYQAERIASKNDLSIDEVNALIEKNTSKRLLGFIGEETVNVLRFNLMLDKIL